MIFLGGKEVTSDNVAEFCSSFLDRRECLLGRRRCRGSGGLGIMLKLVGVAGMSPRRPTALDLEVLCHWANVFRRWNQARQAPGLNDVLGILCPRRHDQPRTQG